MTPGARWIGPVAVLALVVSPGCEKSPERKAAEAAQNVSAAAASREQQQLWQDVADKGSAPGLERVPVVLQPVEQRGGSQQKAGAQSAPVPPQPTIAIPQAVQSAIRILQYPSQPAVSYEGPATVVDATGDRIQLNLGSGRTLSVLARAGGAPIRVAAGETVRVAYVSRVDPDAQHTVIAVRNAAGAGIAHVILGSDNPVEVTVPLFDVNAKQLDDQPGSPVRIIAGPGVAPRTMRQGEIAQVGEFTVFVVGSAGVGKGTGVALIDGNPFALNVMVWKVP